METIDMFVPEKPDHHSPDRRYEQNRGDVEDWGSSRDESHPCTPSTKTGKRKSSECDRQPESPPELERQHAPNNWHQEKHFRTSDPMETDSPASYPKHVMVPSNERYSRNGNQPSYHDSSPSKVSVSTPVLSTEHGSGMQGGNYEHPMYRPSYNYAPEGGNHYQSPPPQGRPYYDIEPSQYAPQGQPEAFMRPRQWACDYCNIATFVSYEEACAHEEACARQYHERYGGRPNPSRGPIPQYDRPPPGPHGHGGLGALYHASQEVGGPPPMWNRGPPMPQLPHDSYHGHHHHHHRQPPNPYQTPPRYSGYPGYDGRDGRPHHGHAHDPYGPQQKRVLLAMPTDSDSLSDRQCYVRSEMVEIFAATSKDVSARHSKGAQKLEEGQVGIRCLHCSHLRPRDRAERAVCYPSSISRIYQTVADMQRFHFEQCREIPAEIRKIYKSLKTTRPRGVGSPQTYWVQSAKLLDLADTDSGIRFTTDATNNTEPSS